MFRAYGLPENGTMDEKRKSFGLFMVYGRCLWRIKRRVCEYDLRGRGGEGG